MHSHNYFTLSAYCLTKYASTTFYYTTPLITSTKGDIKYVVTCRLHETCVMVSALECTSCSLIYPSELYHTTAFLL